RVLQVTPRATAGLPEISGVRGTIVEGEELGRGTRDALKVGRGLSEHLPGVVASVSPDRDASLVAGGDIRFGSTDELDDKIVAVETVLADVDMSCLGGLDGGVRGSRGWG